MIINGIAIEVRPAIEKGRSTVDLMDHRQPAELWYALTPGHLLLNLPTETLRNLAELILKETGDGA